MYYFKTKKGGFGWCVNQEIIGDIIWITEEEYNELLEAQEVIEMEG